MKTYAILGNCQANALASTLQCCAQFKSEFEFRRVTPIHRILESEHKAFLRDTLPECNLFAFQPISSSFRGGGFGFAEALEALPKHVRVVSYPSIQFYGYHAAARTFRELPDDVRTLTRDIFGQPGAELFHFSQIMMSFLLGFDKSRAVEKFHQGFEGDADFVQRRCNASLDHLERSENEFGVDARLHDRIVGDFRKRQLFWSPRHPTGELLAEVAAKMLRKIDIEPTSEDLAQMQRRDPLKFPRYPLQGFVREALGLEFDGPSEFSSKTVSFSVPEMVDGYYRLYKGLGKDAVSGLLSRYFGGLKSWKRFVAQ